MKSVVNILGLVALHIMLACCANSKSENRGDSIKEIDNTGIVKDTATGTAGSNTRKYQTSRDYKTFWKEFRKAMLNSDSIKLQQMTTFPLKTHGNLDEDPKVNIQGKDFYKVFKGMLEESHLEHDSLVENRIVTCLDEVKRDSSEIKEYPITSDQTTYRFCNMEFILTNLGWKLELVYLDTNELKKKLKM